MLVKNRLIITGSPRSGKSSILSNMSDSDPLYSNVFQNAPHLAKNGQGEDKSIMLDYGEIILDSDRKLEIYATPGQVKFQFMWKVLSKKAVGLIIMIDNRRPNPVGDMHMYLENFEGLIDPRAIVVGLNHCDAGGATPEEFEESLAEKGYVLPIVSVDPRQRDEAIYLLATMLASISV